jgi:hypothetical protein
MTSPSNSLAISAVVNICVCFHRDSSKSPIDLKNPAHYNGRQIDNSTPTLIGISMSSAISYGMTRSGSEVLMDAPIIAAKNYVQQTS